MPVITFVVTLPSRTARGWLDVRRRAARAALRRRARLSGAAEVGGAAAAVGRAPGHRIRSRGAARACGRGVLPRARARSAKGGHVIHKNLRLAGGGRRRDRPRGVSDRGGRLRGARRDSGERRVGPFALLNPGAAGRTSAGRPIGSAASRLAARSHGLRRSCCGGPARSDAAERSSRSSRRGRRGAADALPDLVALSRAARSWSPATPARRTSRPRSARRSSRCSVRPIRLRNGPWDAADDRRSRATSACDCHYERRCRASGERVVPRDDQRRRSRGAIDDRLRRAGPEPSLEP